MNISKSSVGDLYANLTYDDAKSAIEFLKSSFGFRERLIVSGPGDTVLHSELTLGGAVVMVSSPKLDVNRIGQRNLNGASSALSVCVADPDSHYRTAMAGGAEIVDEPQDETFGARGYMVKDCEGHLWYFGNYRPGAHWVE